MVSHERSLCIHDKQTTWKSSDSYHELNYRLHKKKMKQLLGWEYIAPFWTLKTVNKSFLVAPSGLNWSLTEPCGGVLSCPLPCFLHSHTSKNLCRGGNFCKIRCQIPVNFAFQRWREVFPELQQAGLFLMTPTQAESTTAERPCGRRTCSVENITGLNTLRHTYGM